MAYSATAKSLTSPFNLLARAANPFWNMLIRAAENHPKMKAVNQLNAQSDEQLAARGTTRIDEVRRIFTSHYYL
jgi:hypothetical protein